MTPESCACGQQHEPAAAFPVKLCAPVAAHRAAAHPFPILGTPAGEQQALCPLGSCMLVNELALEIPEETSANNNMARL